MGSVERAQYMYAGGLAAGSTHRGDEREDGVDEWMRGERALGVLPHYERALPWLCRRPGATCSTSTHSHTTQCLEARSRPSRRVSHVCTRPLFIPCRSSNAPRAI